MVNTIANDLKDHLPAASLVTEETLITRIGNIALPALKLYQPISPILSIASTAYKFSCIFLKTGSDIINFDRAALREDGKNVIRLTSMVALSILFPKVCSVGLNIYEIGFNLNQFTKNMTANNHNAAVQDLAGVVQAMATIGMETYAATEMIALSLIAQALKEILQSTKEFNNDRYLEGIANLIFATIRVQRAVPFIQTANNKAFN